MLEDLVDPKRFEHFQTTINRLLYFFRDPLRLIFSARRGVDFTKLVREGWWILVNLDSSLDLDLMDARLLGSIVINQVLTAIDRLFYRGYSNYYNMYLDEAGEYPSMKLARTMELKAKTKLRVTISHQSFAQFADKDLLNRILAVTNWKMMLNLPNSEDRDRISRIFYGGNIPYWEASFANSDIPKQHAVVKIGKALPKRVKLPTVAEPWERKKNFDNLFHQYICKLYEQPWYFDPRETQTQLKATYVQPAATSYPPSSRKPAKADDQATDQTIKGKSAFSRAKPPGSK